MDFYISATTDIGAKRKVNQDSLFVRKISTKTGKMVFAVLCDGMGGLKHGEVASASIVSAFSDWMYKSLPILSQYPLEDHIIKAEWESVISEQNSKIYLYGVRNNCVAGSTVTALLLTENRYFILNIGDTRAYEVDDNVKQLTQDHTIVAKEIALGNMTPDQAANSPMRHVLTRCVGASKVTYPDMFFGNTKKETLYMICSDGFWHHITFEEIREHLLIKNRKNVSGMKRQEEKLVEFNKSRGETDNISIITILAEE